MSDPPRQDPVCEDPAILEIVDQALLSLWSVVSQLSHIHPPGDRYRVAIFGSARLGPGQPLYDEVRSLAERLSRAGCDLVTGGGPGLMQAANEGAQAGDPEDERDSVGIRIDLPFEQGANPFVEKLYTHRTFFSRLHQFVRLSNAYVVVPGGIGTTLEMLMVWQLLQVRHLRDVPLVLVGRMWRGLVEWATTHMTRGGVPLASVEDVRLPTCVDGVAEAAEVVEAHRGRWLEARSRRPEGRR
jgi:uncharacterized protein (TIGR00730 family)